MKFLHRDDQLGHLGYSERDYGQTLLFQFEKALLHLKRESHLLRPHQLVIAAGDDDFFHVDAVHDIGDHALPVPVLEFFDLVLSIQLSERFTWNDTLYLVNDGFRERVLARFLSEHRQIEQGGLVCDVLRLNFKVISY